MRSRFTFILVGVSALASVCAVGIHAQGANPALNPPPPPRPEGGYKRMQGPETLNPGEWPLHFPYPDVYDAPVGASEPHWLLYVDSKVRFVEVGYFPGIKGKMHGHPYSSVFANDSPRPPNDFDLKLDPERVPVATMGKGPGGAQYPSCRTMGPQAPHAETNQDTYPDHFYRLEYRRVDGPAITRNWREWYPEATRPAPVARGAGPSEDGTVAAPGNFRILMEDSHVRLVEVLIRPGETTPMHTDKYPAVLAIDTADAPMKLDDKPVDRSAGISPINTLVPAMGCETTAPRSPHAIHNAGTTPAHYYRIEFKRIDGDAFRTRWREWYPRMANMEKAYAKTPSPVNY